MIVWGGGDGPTLCSSSLNTGGRCDNPSTDSWTATSTTNSARCPIRGSSPAVWTGSEMIVWGGSSGVSYFEHRREIQSRHEQLDSHQHHQRALCPRGSHGSVDGQRNDRLGRIWSPAAAISTLAGDTARQSGANAYADTYRQHLHLTLRQRQQLLLIASATATPTATATATPSVTPRATPTATPTSTPRVRANAEGCVPHAGAAPIGGKVRVGREEARNSRSKSPRVSQP